MTALATGLGPPAARAVRGQAGQEIEHPDGDRHPRRPDHVDAAEPFVVPVLYLRFGRGAAQRRAQELA
jgi:hypothetical protein